MRDSHLSLEAVESLVVKDLADKSHILMSGDDTPVVDGYAAAFLTSVLQGKKSVIAGIGRCKAVVAVYAEDAALLVQLLGEEIVWIDTQGIHPNNYCPRPILLIISA